MKTRRLVSGLLGSALALCIGVVTLSLLLSGCGTSAPLMESMLRRHAPPETTGLPEDDYAPVAEMIADYLAGGRSEVSYTVPTEGGEREAFNARERQHMADCLSLFRLARTVLLAGTALTGLVSVALLVRRDRRGAAFGCMLGSVALLALMAAAACWAALDFDGAFVLFHRLSFSNELWMMNPATDLLIRLMPLSFFMQYAAIIGALLVLALLVTAIVSLAIWRGR